MIPNFPEFTKLDISHKEIVNDFFTRFPAYSEFGFTNMFVWDTTKPVMLSVLYENLVIKFVDFTSNAYYLTVIGTTEIKKTALELLAYAKEQGYHPELHNIPEHMIGELLELEDFQIEEELDNNDYIISIPFLSKLEGTKLEDKRHKVNQFTRTYENRAEFKKIDLHDKKSVSAITSVLESWMPENPASKQELIIELTAIQKALIHHEHLVLEAFGAYIDGVLEGFTIIEKVHNKMVIGHFEKGNKKHTGIYEYMNHSLSRHLHAEGYEYLNICQDLGYDGLRRAKMSYNPVTFHRKYTVKHAMSSKS